MSTYGPTYSAQHDQGRLASQMETIRTFMLRSQWVTLGEIERATGYGQSSISAQLRHLKKAQFGGYILEKQSRGERYRGLWEYRLLAPKQVGAVQLELLEKGGMRCN